MAGEWQVEMLWRCTACANKNLGRYTACQRCGKPKTGAEEYEMPSDTSEANAVADAALVQLATEGANWRCKYCGSDQRRHDGVCAQCGASQTQGRDLGAVDTGAMPDFHPRPRRWAVAALAIAGGLLLLLIGVSVRRAHTPRLSGPPQYVDVDTVVSAVAWEDVVEVERYRLVDREGFAEARPAAAEDVHPAGKRVHHTDKVPDGFRSETYTETVPDGFRTETYTDHEACGQDCTPRPQTCRQSCTPNKNGFASCKNVCTGGGQDCKTRYCSTTKTRQVPQTKTVTKTRQVQQYRDEPRYADWFTWKEWAWTHDRTLTEHDATLEPRWPAPEQEKLGEGLAPGEQERERRSAKYQVTFTGGAWTWQIAPDALEAFQRFAVGSRHRLRVHAGGAVTCLDEVGDGG